MGVEFSKELVLTACVLLGSSFFLVGHDHALDFKLFLLHHCFEASLIRLVFRGDGESAARCDEVREGAWRRNSGYGVDFFRVPHPEPGARQQLGGMVI